MRFLIVDVLEDVAAFVAGSFADLAALRRVSADCHDAVVGCFRAHAREEAERAALAGGRSDFPTCLAALIADQHAQYGLAAAPNAGELEAAKRLSTTRGLAAPHPSAVKVAARQLKLRYSAVSADGGRLLRLLVVSVTPYAFEFESGATQVVAEWLAILAGRAGSSPAWPSTLPWLTCIGSLGGMGSTSSAYGPSCATLSILRSMRRLQCPLGSLRFNDIDEEDFDNVAALLAEWRPPVEELLLRGRRCERTMARMEQLASILAATLRHYDGLLHRAPAPCGSLLDFQAFELAHVGGDALASLSRLRALSLEDTEGSTAALGELAANALPPQLASLTVFDARDPYEVPASESAAFSLHRFLASPESGRALPPLLVQLEVGHVCDADLRSLASAPQAAHLTSFQVLSGTFTGDGLAVIGRLFPSLRHLYISGLETHGRRARTPYASIQAAFADSLSLRGLETLVLEGDAATADSDFESDCGESDASSSSSASRAAAAAAPMMDAALLAIAKSCPLLTELALRYLYFRCAVSAVRDAAPHLRCVDRLSINAFELRPRHAHTFTAAAAQSVLDMVTALPTLRAFTEVTSYNAPWRAATQRAMESATGLPCVVD